MERILTVHNYTNRYTKPCWHGKKSSGRCMKEKTMMKKIPTLLNSALIAICTMHASTVLAEQRVWESLSTPIRCKNIEAQLVSICYGTRKDDEPPICKSQSLEFQRPVKKDIVLFKAVRPPAKGEYVMIGRHAYSWFCSQTEEGKPEILSIAIANWFNERDEDVMMFDEHGSRLASKSADRIARTSSWRGALADPSRNATAHGQITEPAFK